MNIKALIKTITPNFEFLAALVVLTLVLLAFGAVCTALAFGFYYGLAYLFGEQIASAIIAGIWVLGAFCMIVVMPLIERYERIKWEMDHTNDYS